METLKPHEVCGFLLKELKVNSCGACQNPYDKDWTSAVKIPGNKPPPTPPPKVRSLVHNKKLDLAHTACYCINTVFMLSAVVRTFLLVASFQDLLAHWQTLLYCNTQINLCIMVGGGQTGRSSCV